MSWLLEATVIETVTLLNFTINLRQREYKIQNKIKQIRQNLSNLAQIIPVFHNSTILRINTKTTKMVKIII